MRSLSFLDSVVLLLKVIFGSIARFSFQTALIFRRSDVKFNLSHFFCFVKLYFKLFQNFFLQALRSAPLHFRSVRYNLASIFDLSNPNLKIFQFFFGFSRSRRSIFLYQHCSISWRMRFNIALFVNLSNAFLKKIHKKQVFLRLTSRFSASNSLKMRGIRQNMPDSQESLP